MRTAYFHEDHYCQVELLPGENLEWCRAQMDAIEEFSDAHQTGAGWTDMYVRPPAPIPIETRGIALDVLASAIAVPPYDEEVPNVRAFGRDGGITLFAQQRDGVVVAIWLGQQPVVDAEIRSSADALAALAQWNLLLVDWEWNVVIPLSDAPAVHEYLLRLRPPS